MRWLVVLSVGVWAASLLGLGVPRVIASVLKAPAFSTLLAAERGERPPEGRLEIATASLERAMGWEKSGRVRGELGYLLLLRAGQANPGSDERSALFRRAAAVLRESLLLAPARPHVWLWLAYARLPETGLSAETVALLRQSLDAGRFVGGITVSRVELLLRAWGGLPADLRVAVGSQIRYAWPHRSRELIAAARRTGTVHIIRFAVGSLPGALDQLDAATGRGDP